MEVNCRNFGCANNKEGECVLEKIILISTETPLIICIEAYERNQ